MPLTLPVGSITAVDSLVVTDSFGVRTLLRRSATSGTVARNFSMWQPADAAPPGQRARCPDVSSNLFFLPPAIGQVMDSAALEDVLFMRDEMANLAWAIERSIENPIEQARIYRDPAPAPSAPAAAPAPTPRALPAVVDRAGELDSAAAGAAAIRRRQHHLASEARRGAADRRLRRRPTSAQGQALNAGRRPAALRLEVPREGVHVTRARRTSRWIDGSTHYAQ